MTKTKSEGLRVEELRAMLVAYRPTAIGKVGPPGSGDLQFESEEELWRLEQVLYDPRLRGQR